ncbi:hypothetical protein AB0G35_13035 [Streptomyces sp. NPDC021749]|uniref:hypothetical protein n=1 Tax=Streptomyces sp. NPDC021749 TaxID=3154905 RepID=UPI00340228BF
MTSPRTAFLTAPVLMGAYGVLRIIDGLDGSRGPGAAWTVGHLCFLGALVFFVQGFGTMRACAGHNRPAAVGWWTGTAGAVALAVQFLIDLTVGFLSADHGAMQELFAHVQAIPGVLPLVYDYGPLLFFVGQLILVVQLAVRRVLKPWAPVLVLVSITLPFASKDLIPLGAALLLLAFAPLYRPGADPRRRSRVRPA